MLRIQIEDGPNSTTLYVEGKLTGNHVDELRRIWTSIRNESPDRQTVVDLGSVRFVDTAGKELLSQMHGVGTRLSGSGLCISALIGEITGVRVEADL